jgi:hypothetical protein
MEKTSSLLAVYALFRFAYQFILRNDTLPTRTSKSSDRPLLAKIGTHRVIAPLICLGGPTLRRNTAIWPFHCKRSL